MLYILQLQSEVCKYQYGWYVLVHVGNKYLLHFRSNQENRPDPSVVCLIGMSHKYTSND